MVPLGVQRGLAELGHQVVEIIRNHKYVHEREGPAGAVHSYVLNLIKIWRRLTGVDNLPDKAQAENVINRMVHFFV